MAAKIRDVMFAVFKLSPINSNASSSEIKIWKSDPTVKDCYRSLFKKINPTEPGTYMSRIIERMWKGKRKGPKVQIAFAISICETILNPDNSFITMNEEIIKPVLTKNLVSFLNYTVNIQIFFNRLY